MIRKESLPNNPVLQRVLRELVQEEFDSYSEDVEFSEAYKKKKEKLLRMQERPYWKYVNTIGQKIAVILISLVVLSSSIITVYGAWKPVIECIKRTYERCTDFIFPSGANQKGLPGTLETAYMLREIPDGFQRTIEDADELGLRFEWEHENGDRLVFNQVIVGTTIGLNTEDAVEEAVTVNGHSAMLYTHPERQFLLWHTEEYIFYIVLLSDVDTITNGSIDLVELASNLVPMDPTV